MMEYIDSYLGRLYAASLVLKHLEKNTNCIEHTPKRCEMVPAKEIFILFCPSDDNLDILQNRPGRFFTVLSVAFSESLAL